MEVQVYEIIEINVKKVTYIIHQNGPLSIEEMQYENFPDIILEPAPAAPSIYDENWDEKSDWELDREYEEMLENDPKKITREMREAYEQRQKERENELKLEQEREKQYKIAQARALEDTKAYLNSKKIPFSVQKLSELNKTDYYRPRTKDTSDSVLVLEFSDQKAFDECRKGLNLKFISFELYEVQYQDYLKDIAPSLLPKMEKNAKEEAKTLASAMNCRVGKIESISNAVPFSTLNLTAEMMVIIQKSMQVNAEDRYNSNPISMVSEQVKSYIFRFSVVPL